MVRVIITLDQMTHWANMLDQVDKKTSGRWQTIQPAVTAIREHHRVITNLVEVFKIAAEKREAASATARATAYLRRAMNVLA